MPTKFLQADGLISEGVRPFNGITYANGTVFTPSETKAPATAETNSIVVYDNFDGTHHQLKNVGGATLDSDGVVSTEVAFNNLIDKSTKDQEQIVVVNPGDTDIVIDLALGSVIKLSHDENVTITFTNIPVDKVVPVTIERTKANNSTPKTISFTHTLKVEGRQQLVFSNKANSRDDLLLFIKNSEIYCCLPIPDFKQAPGTQPLIVESTGTKVVKTDVVRSADSDTIVSFTAAGNFVSTGVGWDGTTFTTRVNSVKNTIALMYFPFESKTASTNNGVVEYDTSSAIFGELLLDDNVTSFGLLNLPLPNLLTYTLFLKHDNTSNVYDITWTTDFKYDTRPAITQEANAEDIMVITTLDSGNKAVHFLQNFGLPL